MMNSSGKTLTVLIGGLVVVTLLAFLALSGVAATFAWMAGGGYGSGPSLCQAVTPGTDFRQICRSIYVWWKHLSLRASEPGRCAGRGLGASNGLCAVRESSLWGTHQLPGLLRHLVQSTRLRFPTWRAHLPAGGYPVRRAGLSGLLRLGQRHLPVREFRARGLLPGLPHAADRQCLRPVGGLCNATRVEGDSLSVYPCRTARHPHAGRRDGLQGCKHRACGDCDECRVADLHDRWCDNVQQLQQRESVHHHATVTRSDCRYRRLARLHCLGLYPSQHWGSFDAGTGTIIWSDIAMSTTAQEGEAHQCMRKL